MEVYSLPCLKKQKKKKKKKNSLEPIIIYRNIKVRKSLFSFACFLSNNKVPLTFKRFIIQSYIISKTLYFAPLLGSNKNNSKNVQSLI